MHGRNDRHRRHYDTDEFDTSSVSDDLRNVSSDIPESYACDGLDGLSRSEHERMLQSIYRRLMIRGLLLFLAFIFAAITGSVDDACAFWAQV